MNAVETFDFYGQNIDLVEQGGENYLLLGQLCSHMGLHAQGQQESLDRQVWAQGKTRVTRVQLPGDNQARNRYLIDVKIVGMWLANITSSRINDPHARQMVERYQVELTQKIHEWLTSSAPAPAELSTLQIIELAREAELGRIAAEQRAITESARADATQMILDNVDRGDGIVVREWLKKYFPPRQEQKLWALFYAKRMLKNGLGLGGTDKKGKPKPSRDHQAVLTDGQSFFIRTLKKDFVGDDVKRYETKVRPGRAELELVAYCEKHGIAPLPEVSQALFEINDLSRVFAPELELEAVAS